MLGVGIEAHKLVDSYDNKDYIFYGRAVSKQSHSMWKIKLDLLLVSENEVLVSQEEEVCQKSLG